MNLQLVEEDFKPTNIGWRSDAVETGKIHLSDIAKYIEWKHSLGEPIKATDWDLMIAATVGFIWEDVLSMMLGNRYAARIGEIELDGVVGSPDGLSDNDPWGVYPVINEEYKATWKSMNFPPEKNWYWMTQFKSYCHMLGVKVTLLRVLYIMGDYKGSGPRYRVFRIEFTDEELKANWDLILQHRDEMVEKGFMNLRQAKGEV